MRRLRPALSGAALLALAGCGLGQPMTVQLANAIAMTREQGGKFIGLVGPKQQHDEPFLGVRNTNYFTLRSLIDTSSGQTVHQLYVEDSYLGPKRSWNAASANGQPLRFVPVSTNEITCERGCAYAEEFAAELPDQLLRASPQGLTVRFTAQSGADKLILLPGDTIRKQLAAVDQARAALPAATAAAGPAPLAPAPAAAAQR